MRFVGAQVLHMKEEEGLWYQKAYLVGPTLIYPSPMPLHILISMLKIIASRPPKSSPSSPSPPPPPPPSHTSPPQTSPPRTSNPSAKSPPPSPPLRLLVPLRRSIRERRRWRRMMIVLCVMIVWGRGGSWFMIWGLPGGVGSRFMRR